MNFNRIGAGFAAAAVIAVSFSAHAADFGNRYKAPAYTAPAYSNWSGFYVGLNAGYGMGKSNWDVPAVSTSPKGALAGLTVGYNFQTGSWLWGAEGDFDMSTMKGSVTCGVDNCETKNTWLGTARARIGYAGWNNWLPYLTFGGAFGNVKATESINGSASKMKIGWTAGLGVEYALWTNWSVKAEYLYVDLGKFDCGVSCSGVGTDNVSFNANLIRLGVNYRF